MSAGMMSAGVHQLAKADLNPYVQTDDCAGMIRLWNTSRRMASCPMISTPTWLSSPPAQLAACCSRQPLR
jgi:hypothetical protein